MSFSDILNNVTVWECTSEINQFSLIKDFIVRLESLNFSFFRSISSRISFFLLLLVIFLFLIIFFINLFLPGLIFASYLFSLSGLVVTRFFNGSSCLLDFEIFKLFRPLSKDQKVEIWEKLVDQFVEDQGSTIFSSILKEKATTVVSLVEYTNCPQTINEIYISALSSFYSQEDFYLKQSMSSDYSSIISWLNDFLGPDMVNEFTVIPFFIFISFSMFKTWPDGFPSLSLCEGIRKFFSFFWNEEKSLDNQENLPENLDCYISGYSTENPPPLRLPKYLPYDQYIHGYSPKPPLPFKKALLDADFPWCNRSKYCLDPIVKSEQAVFLEKATPEQLNYFADSYDINTTFETLSEIGYNRFLKRNIRYFEEHYAITKYDRAFYKPELVKVITETNEYTESWRTMSREDFIREHGVETFNLITRVKVMPKEVEHLLVDSLNEI